MVNFRGTDSLAALHLGRHYYNCPTAGLSIPATEHSAMTVWGEENETNAYSNLFHLYPSGTFACVSDSYDIWNACSKIWGEALRDKRIIESRGTLDGKHLFRPQFTSHWQKSNTGLLRLQGDPLWPF
ncbi:unnamed protein product [Trichobilharzia regenti]|nr:unnamed protein product [Trichobilharzia regenti]